MFRTCKNNVRKATFFVQLIMCTSSQLSKKKQQKNQQGSFLTKNVKGKLKRKKTYLKKTYLKMKAKCRKRNKKTERIAF